jgi:hypothetical protein
VIASTAYLEEVLVRLVAWRDFHGLWPTGRELGPLLGRSRNWTCQILRELGRRGFIVRPARVSRSVRLTEHGWRAVRGHAPLGRLEVPWVAWGPPEIEAEEGACRTT